MKKSAIFAIPLVLLVLATSFALPVYTHFCQGEVADISIFSPEENCTETKAKSSCCKIQVKTNQKEISHKSCCSDKLDLISIETEYTSESLEVLEKSSELEFLDPAEFAIQSIGIGNQLYSALEYYLKENPTNGPPEDNTFRIGNSPAILQILPRGSL